ncbi:Got1-domain-containing protein [Piedraia hortae CBS 480.64]|uniref:Got1-domain-containing protein n=1 Tax=Piedraia hortae CBS 480.64 TaxID=1314780 RepID=A0A6A7BZ56_9PEZI|nr:Got1-domain-containing protein [Piedraia hortae CBS 480.64]
MPYWMSDTQKIGVGLCAIGTAFLSLGVIMFLDRALLAMGNLLLVAGIVTLLGFPRTVKFFFGRREKWKGAVAFWLGIALVLSRWTWGGFMLELAGGWVLFGEFFKTMSTFAWNIPVVGPYLAKGLRFAGEKAGADQRAHKDLPV